MFFKAKNINTLSCFIGGDIEKIKPKRNGVLSFDRIGAVFYRSFMLK